MLDERADFSPLFGRRVILWPDNDRPGMEHMQRVAAKLAALGCAVETLDIGTLDLPNGGDVVDYLTGQPNVRPQRFHCPSCGHHRNARMVDEGFVDIGVSSTRRDERTRGSTAARAGWMRHAWIMYWSLAT